MNDMTLASAGPIVTIKGDRAFANSRDVAEFFEKEHRNVLRDIDNLIATEPEAALNFEQSSWKDTTGRSNRCFDMDQEGFTLLAMGFTGPKALHFKRLYIRAFNAAMEEIQRLRSQAPALPNFANPAEAARAWASEYEQKVLAQQKLEYVEQRLIEAQPKIALADRVVEKKRTINRVCRARHEAPASRRRDG